MESWRYWRFIQIRQITFNCTDMQIMHFILDKMLKLLTYYTPFCHRSLQVMWSQVRFFGPPCVSVCVVAKLPKQCMYISFFVCAYVCVDAKFDKPWLHVSDRGERGMYLQLVLGLPFSTCSLTFCSWCIGLLPLFNFQLHLLSEIIMYIQLSLAVKFVVLISINNILMLL